MSKPVIILPEATAAAAHVMQNAWHREQFLASKEKREAVAPKFAPTPESVRQVRAARDRRARRAEKAVRLAARPALGVIAFLCWATGRAMRVEVEHVG